MNFDNQRRIAAFVHEARFRNFPATVVQQSKRCFLDLLASSLAGIPSHAGRVAREFACSFEGAPNSSLFGDSRRVPLPLAVFANTTVCEALDCDDGYNPVKGHPGAFLFPAVMAFVENGRLSGERALEALIVGYEIGMRTGRIIHETSPVYHGSGAWGGVGTAAIAARLCCLNEEQTGHALGAAEYHGTMAPIMRCVAYPAMVKDAIGWSAFTGVSAATMAKQGFTSSPSLFATDEATPFVESLGKEFLMLDLYFKPYCCCRWAHPSIRAALQIQAEFQLRLDAIEVISIQTFAEACALSRKVPATSEEAQYSVAYPVAAALVEGDAGPEQMLEGCLSNPAVRRLMERIDFQFREDFQAEFPARRLAQVTIHANGKSYDSGVVAAHGDPADPLSEAEIESKFLRYATPWLGDARSREVLRLVGSLEELPDLDAIWSSLRPA